MEQFNLKCPKTSRACKKIWDKKQIDVRNGALSIIKTYREQKRIGFREHTNQYVVKYILTEALKYKKMLFF